ncbi:MAG: BatD family protein [Bacteroides sp.]|nr:BatD family protein [Bacteroides sp.]MCM1446731.1 BatD family protein [Bacteroides sp.]
MNRLLSTIVFWVLVGTFGTLAQTVHVQAPDRCEVGRRINVSYVVDTQDVEDIRVGEFTGFELLYGPSTSRQSSFQMVNGKATQSSSITFTYVLLAQKEGEFKLPVASVDVTGKTIRSNPTTITVLPSSGGNGGNGGATGTQGRQGQSHGRHNSTETLDDRDLFITATASKTKLFEQEAVVLTYKLYTLVNIRQLAGEMPELDGFHCQELNNKAQLSLKYEHYNGRNYGTAIWRQYVLFPQKSGKLTIPSISFDAEVEITNASADPFDLFFGGGSLTQMVRKTIKTPSIDLDVTALPTPCPDNFSGAVGKFSMTGTLTPEQLNANDAATLKLVVSGQGNMKLMKAPSLEAPKDFEVYTPKETDKTTNTASGAKGSVIFDYVMVPRHGGNYTIPAIEFVYFDPEAKKYVTLHTDSFKLSVAKSKTAASGSVTEKEDVRILSSDIHFIKSGRADIRDSVDDFFATPYYYLWYLCLAAMFMIIFAVFRRHAKANADIVRKRGKRAGKEAAKRLKQARKLLKNHDTGAFYEETLRALLGYVADKLNIPTTDLAKENVREALVARGVDEALIQQYVEVLEACEFARFAPGDPQATMDKIYDLSTQAITNLNKSL